MVRSTTSGPGWDGYQSQNFLDLIDRAHAAGDRVVITVNDFSQSSLDQLAASSTAPQTLAQSLLLVVKAKDLDGVNLDLEGSGSGDQVGITNIVQVVSQTLKAANPHYQVTMDTYAVLRRRHLRLLRHSGPQLVRGRVLRHGLSAQPRTRRPTAQSALTSSMFSNQTAVNQYVNAVPASKVILGLPFFGYDWPTTNGTLERATGRWAEHHHLRPGGGERPSHVLGPRHRHRLDVLPGGLAMARGLLREPRLLVSRRTNGPGERHRRCRRLGAGHGRLATTRRWCPPSTATPRPRRTNWPAPRRPARRRTPWSSPR